jgi:hypothetical protein
MLILGYFTSSKDLLLPNAAWMFQHGKRAKITANNEAENSLLLSTLLWYRFLI